MRVFEEFVVCEGDSERVQHRQLVEQHDKGLAVRALVHRVVAGVAAVEALLVRIEVDVVPLGGVGVLHDACFSECL